MIPDVPRHPIRTTLLRVLLITAVMDGLMFLLLLLCGLGFRLLNFPLNNVLDALFHAALFIPLLVGLFFWCAVAPKKAPVAVGCGTGGHCRPFDTSHSRHVCLAFSFAAVFIFLRLSGSDTTVDGRSADRRTRVAAAESRTLSVCLCSLFCALHIGLLGVL